MKAVLVIDMPSRCFGCKLHRVIYGENGNEFMAFCWLLRRPVNDLDERPLWCPLRPLPHKLQADWYTDGYKEGFNACLEEITGETE